MNKLSAFRRFATAFQPGWVRDSDVIRLT